jgi:hypothetical protein
MVERILPFFQRGEKALRWAGLPKAWPDNLVLCRPSSSVKDALSLAGAKTGVLITGQTGKGKTSGPGRLLAKAYLRAGFGGLVLSYMVGGLSILLVQPLMPFLPRRWLAQKTRDPGSSFW